MKYLGKITDDKDLVTKEYVDNSIPVKSVNTKTGDVVLTASDVGALAETGGETSTFSLYASDESGDHTSAIDATPTFSGMASVDLNSGVLGKFDIDTTYPQSHVCLYYDGESRCGINLGELGVEITSFTSTLDAGKVTINNMDVATKKYVDDSIPDTSTFMVKGIDYVTAGQKSGTTLGTQATAEGRTTIASGNYSHAEGIGATASGQTSHAEGSYTTASGTQSHAEGSGATASGLASHAEGNSTTASGKYSHAEGYLSRAQRRSQHVFGEYNIAESGDTGSKGIYVEIVGNGSSDSNRSNARTLDWNGNEVLAGKLTVGTAPTNDMDVATKTYVDTALALKANTASPTFTGTPKAPTAVAGTNDTQIATTAFVQAAVSGKQAHYKEALVNLPANGWDPVTKWQTKTGVTGVKQTNLVIISPYPTAVTDYANAGIACIEQAPNSLTFECQTIPSVSISVNVVIFD